jgi:hypothetical protein
MTAACFVERTYCAVGDQASGWFFLPPWSLWADWAKDEANRQAERMKQRGQMIEITRGGSK